MQVHPELYQSIEQTLGAASPLMDKSEMWLGIVTIIWRQTKKIVFISKALQITDEDRYTDEKRKNVRVMSGSTPQS